MRITTRKTRKISPIKEPQRSKIGRRRPTTTRRAHARISCRAQKTISSGGRGKSTTSCRSKVVSDKLEALKNLINPTHNGEIVETDKLFQETADYIVLLRTQVLILQSMIEFYGSSSETENAVNANVVL